MAWTAPRTWVAGETVTAALLNSHLRDNLKAIGDPWATYTPSWTGSGGNPAIGNGTLAGWYMQAGKLVHFRISIIAGSTTTYGSGNYSLTLPVAPTSYRWRFSGATANAGAADYPMWGRSLGAGSTTLELVVPTGAGTSDAFVTPTVPYTMGSTDYITLHGTYEAA